MSNEDVKASAVFERIIQFAAESTFQQELRANQIKTMTLLRELSKSEDEGITVSSDRLLDWFFTYIKTIYGQEYMESKDDAQAVASLQRKTTDLLDTSDPDKWRDRIKKYIEYQLWRLNEIRGQIDKANLLTQAEEEHLLGMILERLPKKGGLLESAVSYFRKRLFNDRSRK